MSTPDPTTTDSLQAATDATRRLQIHNERGVTTDSENTDEAKLKEVYTCVQKLGAIITCRWTHPRKLLDFAIDCMTHFRIIMNEGQHIWRPQYVSVDEINPCIKSIENIRTSILKNFPDYHWRFFIKWVRDTLYTQLKLQIPN